MALKKIIISAPYAAQDEGVAGGAIKPGMRIKQGSAGTYTVVTTQGGAGPVIIACEQRLSGGTVDDAYASTDRIAWVQPLPGDEVLVLLLQNENVVIGDALIVNTAGKYIKTTGTPAQTDFTALEALNPTSADGLIRARKN